MTTDRERRRRKAVARRRRTLALLALLVVAALVVVALMWRPWEGRDEPPAGPETSASAERISDASPCFVLEDRPVAPVEEAAG